MLITNKATIKNCSSCNQVKPVSEFYRQARAYSGLCRSCAKAWSHQQAKDGYFRARRAAVAATKPPARNIRLTDIERVAHDLYRNVRRRSLRSGWALGITRQWVEDQIRAFAEKNYCEFASKSPFKPSLDRIRSKGIYEPSNVRVCWMIENYARNTFTDEQVLEFCKRKLGLL